MLAAVTSIFSAERSRTWPLAILCALVLAGCPPRVPGVKFGPEGEITDPKVLLGALAKNDARFVTLKGQVKLKASTDTQGGTVDQYLAVVRPAGLHIETFNFFGKPVSTLCSDGQTFSLYDGEHNVFYRGPAVSEVMGRFLPLSLSPDEAVALLLGQVPRIPAQSSTLKLDATKGVYVLELKAGPATQTLEVATDDLRILRSRVTGVEAYNLTLEDYHAEKNGPFPHKLTLEATSGHLTMTYRYVDVQVNGTTDLTLFHQDPPATATITELDANGHPQQQHTP
jgi:outer membrane lipoprotein-sorting protein